MFNLKGDVSDTNFTIKKAQISSCLRIPIANFLANRTLHQSRTRFVDFLVRFLVTASRQFLQFVTLLSHVPIDSIHHQLKTTLSLTVIPLEMHLTD